jgi:hypothetical protein
MARYAVYLHFDLLESVPVRSEQRKRIMDFVRSLADQPHAPGDFTDIDESQRTRQIKIIGNYAVTYWADEPVRIVMVVGVRPADR